MDKQMKHFEKDHLMRQGQLVLQMELSLDPVEEMGVAQSDRWFGLGIEHRSSDSLWLLVLLGS